MKNGEYSVAWSQGRSLGAYLRALGLLKIGLFSAIYDLTHPERGRRRTSYCPQQDSVVLLAPPGYGSQARFQRVSGDTQEIARKMGGGSKIVKVPV